MVSNCDSVDILVRLTCPPSHVLPSPWSHWCHRDREERYIIFLRGGKLIDLLFLSARDSIWINPGFQEQLVLFQICQYNPHPGDGVYASWKSKVDRKLKVAGCFWRFILITVASFSIYLLIECICIPTSFICNNWYTKLMCWGMLICSRTLKSQKRIEISPVELHWFEAFNMVARLKEAKRCWHHHGGTLRDMRT